MKLVLTFGDSKMKLRIAECFIVISLALYIAGAVAADEYGEEKPCFTLYAVYGSAGHADGQFMNPMGMAVSPDGRRLAVCDTDNNRVVLLKIVPPYEQPASLPEPLAFERTIGGIWPWEGSLAPYDAADRRRESDDLEHANGRAYSGGQSRIRPAAAVPVDRFNRPQAVTWKDSETLVVSDTDNHRVKAVKLNGEVLWILGQEGWKDGYFHNPLGLAYDAAGKLYVCEPISGLNRGLGLDMLQRQSVQGNRIQVFDQNLKPVGRVGNMHHISGRYKRQFKNPVRIWVAFDGSLYIVDSGNHRIVAMDSQFQVKSILERWHFAALRYPKGIHGTDDGRLAIADSGNHRVLIIGAAGEIDQILGGFGVRAGEFSRPCDVAFGPYGYLFVLDTQNCRIQIYSEPYIPKPATPTAELQTAPASLPSPLPADSM